MVPEVHGLVTENVLSLNRPKEEIPAPYRPLGEKLRNT